MHNAAMDERYYDVNEALVAGSSRHHSLEQRMDFVHHPLAPFQPITTSHKRAHDTVQTGQQLPFTPCRSRAHTVLPSSGVAYATTAGGRR
jgi:hypothetical protein